MTSRAVGNDPACVYPVSQSTDGGLSISKDGPRMVVLHVSPSMIDGKRVGCFLLSEGEGDQVLHLPTCLPACSNMLPTCLPACLKHALDPVKTN